VDIATRLPTGCEALVRWHRGGGAKLIGPSSFVPLAEETGLIGALGATVLRRACAEAAAWPDRSLLLAVNLSPAQFRAPGLVESVAAALSEAGLDPRRLELEITEGVLLQSTEEALATMHRLREIGVRFAMDDFGTGYSSLAYLRSFPFDRLKVDRAFVRHIEADPGDVSIVRAVAGMGRELGMTTVAEGVETEGQLRLLAEAGCRHAQGYLFSAPVPASELPAVLARLSARARSRVLV
jgi:EAL domain-containing protein (putative c-di-GMP-specific phosphodiesterase class I)